MVREGELRSEELRLRIDERGAILLDEIRRRQLAVALHQLRLVVEQLQVARAARHEEEDDILRLRREVRLLRGERIILRRRRGAWAEQIGKADGAEADAALLEEPAAAPKD